MTASDLQFVSDWNTYILPLLVVSTLLLGGLAIGGYWLIRTAWRAVTSS